MPGLAFGYMADNNIVHRDVKLDNVCLDKPGGECRVVDLGFARDFTTAPVPSGKRPRTRGGDEMSATLCAPRGNALYRSPENTGAHRVDHKDDMWALGLVVGRCRLTRVVERRVGRD